MVAAITAAVGIAVAIIAVVLIAAATIAGFTMSERITAAGTAAAGIKTARSKKVIPAKEKSGVTPSEQIRAPELKLNEIVFSK